MMIFKSFRKTDDVMKIINGSLVDLPSPSSLTYYWNFGSLLGVFLFSQIITGLFLSFHFSGSVILSFESVEHMMRDVNYGWLVRVLHANGASFFFLLMYFHIGRGLYYKSYYLNKVWMSGVTILLLSMGTAFLGYVLPWGQMSFWAATVITNLLSAVPYMGVMLVEWVWGGFAVGNPTLIRFFSFHFLFPFVILFLVILHLFFLHKHGSSDPVGVGMDLDKISFYPYYMIKDVVGFLMVYFFVMIVCVWVPFVFMDVENFIPSNPLVTPNHIQPEWYFLFAYTILRSVPSKIGGVVALLMSVLVLYLLSFVMSSRFRSNLFYKYQKIIFWYFVVNWLLLTWIGACPVESPFSDIGVFLSVAYFFMYIGFFLMEQIQDGILEWLY